jgi:predicted transcriptional regulator
VNAQSLVFLLCFATSAVCAALLLRSYIATRTRLLLWSALCFLFLTVNNLLVVVDMIVLPGTLDLQLFRQLASLGAACVLVFGFVWDSD